MKNRELHLHIDGSLRINTVWDISKKLKIDLGISEHELNDSMKIAKDCNNLNDYLSRFAIPTKVLQSPYAIERVSYELVKDLASLGMDYGEIRFAPQLHLNNGNTQEEILLAAINGIKQAEYEVGSFKTGLIICMMRGIDNYELNRQSFLLTNKYLGDTVCALDIAGAEAIYPTRLFVKTLRDAKKAGLPLTIHAGEAGTKEDLEIAIDLNADRIGHGVLANKHEDLIRKLIEKNITLEVCVTSNLQTRIVEKFEDHPIRNLFDKGVKIAVSSDNMTVSDTNINKEFEILKTKLNFSETELNKIRKDTIAASFL